MINSMKRAVQASLSRIAASKTRGRGVVWSSRLARGFLVALVGFAVFAPVWSNPVGAAANDFTLSFEDKNTGDNLFVNFITGDYMFFNKTRQSYFAGKGELTVNACAIELQDSGANRKAPDRNVSIFFNPCENITTATCIIFDSGERYALTDANVRGTPMAPVATAREDLPSRFDEYCVEDDASGVTMSIGTIYFFSDTRKGIFLAGFTGNHLIRNGCKVSLVDDGPDPKHPDRHVNLEINICTGKASGYVWVASIGKTYVINDSNILDSRCLL